MNISDFFYTSGQAARLLKVTRITIWRWVRANKFNAQYIGDEALIPKWEVDLAAASPPHKRRMKRCGGNTAQKESISRDTCVESR